METKLRSATKSVIWRITGVVILAIITYLFTGNWMQTGLITIIHHGVFLFVFYFCCLILFKIVYGILVTQISLFMEAIISLVKLLQELKK